MKKSKASVRLEDANGKMGTIRSVPKDFPRRNKESDPKVEGTIKPASTLNRKSISSPNVQTDKGKN